MFLHKVKSEGLSHLSYVIGDGTHAAVIDPRRDCACYCDIARSEGARITHIFETHRNEDYVIGSVPLAAMTGAVIYHGKALDFAYGENVSEGDTFELGGARLRVLETPGHTFESISLALYDQEFGPGAVGVFTGDALFIGDVGRTDFFPDRAEEVAGLLHTSIHEKLLPLGDQAILYPAHGAGSVCGSGMASREFSTLGYERLYNPALQLGRDAFVEHKIHEEHHQPPYFRKMEEYNLKGNAPDHCSLAQPGAMSADEFEDAMARGMTAVDVRSPEGFAGAFVPGSLAIPLNMVPAYAGWFLSYDAPVGLVTRYEEYDHVEKARRYLMRMGFDDVAGYLAGGMHGWETAGKRYDRVPAVHAADLAARLESEPRPLLLDVRAGEEYTAGHIEGAVNVYLGHLRAHLEKLDRSQTVITFCGSGRRAIIAASLLKKAGFEDVENCLGSMAACGSSGCPIETG